MIALNQIKKSRQERVILNDISVTFSDNQHYVIFGESGNGKTTLLNIIADYEQADSGTVYVDNNAKIQYLFQDTLLFSNITVKDNMFIKWLGEHQTINQEEFEKKSRDALKLFSVEQFIDKKVYTLSGGEKQRVELAQVFLSEPDILLLDEPTANLDSENKKSIIEIIGKNFKNSIIILVSHDDKNYFLNYTLLELKGGKLYFE